MADKYPNFYQNLKEARARLNYTVVMYDGEPYRIAGIADHMGEIFRAYLVPVAQASFNRIPPPHHEDADNFGSTMDDWMNDPKRGGSLGCIRKHLNSPHFNKFRPFELGMMNLQGATYYVERTPNRKMEQGLIPTMLTLHHITLDQNKPMRGAGQYLYTPQFRDCVLGDHPPADIALEAVLSKDIKNTAVAFHRNFAFIRGPLNIVFLAYKEDVIGVVPNNDFSVVRIDPKFEHVVEALRELTLFNAIAM